MSLQLKQEVEDKRGKILMVTYNDKQINIVEIRKGFARGGHYHEFETSHSIISGKIEYREEDVKSGQEKIRTITAPATVLVPANVAHLLIALEDTVFVELFEKQYSAANYKKYRSIVEEKMNS